MRYSIRIMPFVLTGLMVITQGCQQDTKRTQTISIRPSIKTDCIVNYIGDDKAPYITRQQHGFDPAAGYLEIIAQEPTGLYHFSLTKGKFASSKQPSVFLSGLPASFVNQDLATCIFYGFLSGSGILDTDTFASSENAIKLEGQWYKPIETPWPNESVQVTLLKNLSTNQINRVKLDNQKTGVRWMAIIYNYIYSSELNTMVPRKIDIFDIQDGPASKKLILQFDYKSVLVNTAKNEKNENISGN